MTGAALRRLLHASSALVLLTIPFTSWTVFRVAVLASAAVVVAVDTARATVPAVQTHIARLVPVFRPTEEKRLSGAAWLWLGYTVAIAFPEPSPAAGILVAALSDPVASLAGQWTQSKSEKSMIGSVAAFVTACGALAVLDLQVLPVVGGGIAAVVLERWPGPFDDNLVVAPGVAAAVAVLA